ncbi:MAG: hypothetical protein WA956_05660 [Stenotrophomonas sp.]
MLIESGSGVGKGLLVLAGLLSLFGGGAVTGYQYRDREVAELAAQRDASFAAANGQAQTLATIKATLHAERERRNRIELAAQQELAARAERIAELEVAAEKRRQKITTEASKDEDCNALRRMPVCAALADGLWGGTPASVAR